MKNAKIFIGLAILFSLVVLSTACGGGSPATSSEMKKFAEKKVNDNLMITLLGVGGKLKKGDQEVVLAFTDGSGKPVEIKAASLNFNMPAMGSMAEMNDPATLETTSKAGEFKGKLKIEMTGEWIAQISYEGQESGKTTIKTTAY